LGFSLATIGLSILNAGEFHSNIAPLKAVVGFHSRLATDRPPLVRLKVLVQIGADDPIIPSEQRGAFEAEMSTAGVDWRMVVYGGAGTASPTPTSIA
jgi:dienelactone hydrolase